MHRERERAKEEAAKQKERERGQQALDNAQTALDDAEREHAKRAAASQAEAGYQKEIASQRSFSGGRRRLKAALRRARDYADDAARWSEGGIIRLLFRVTGSRLCGFRRLAVLNTAFVTQITAFLRFCFAFWGHAVLVHLFFDEACGFLDFTLDTHVSDLSPGWATVQWLKENAFGPFLILCAAKLACQDRESPFIDRTYFRINRVRGAFRDGFAFGIPRRQTGAAGTAALASIRLCCLRSAQNSGGILACSEL
jgi:hypothetical protein